MSSGWTIEVVPLVVQEAVLGSLVVALSVVCVALGRQLKELSRLIPPIGALVLNRRLVSGSPAPRFSVSTLTGETVDIGLEAAATGDRRSQLLVFLSRSCVVCRSLLPVLKSIQRREKEWLRVILISDGGKLESHKRFVSNYGLEALPYVVSEAVGVAFGASRVPYTALLDDGGIVRAFGLVNSREQLESLFEARRLGQSTVQEFLNQGAGTNTTNHH